MQRPGARAIETLQRPEVLGGPKGVEVIGAFGVLKTPYHAPNENAVCKGFLVGMRREC
jgi:hypothetical protein